MRALPIGAALIAGYELYRWMSASEAGLSFPEGWTLCLECGNPPNGRGRRLAGTLCPARHCNSSFTMGTGVDGYDAVLAMNNSSKIELFAEHPISPAHQGIWQEWRRTGGVNTPDPTVTPEAPPEWEIIPPQEFPIGDPFSLPIGQPAPTPVAPPVFPGARPSRRERTNPFRDPFQQPHRGPRPRPRGDPFARTTPRTRPGAEVEIAPDGSASVSPGHRLERPGPGVRETKMKIAVPAVLHQVLAVLTEGLDVLYCLYRALPPNWKDRRFPTPQRAFALLYRALGSGELDEGFIARALIICGRAQAMDLLFGFIGSRIAQAYAPWAVSTGIQFGPALGDYNFLQNPGPHREYLIEHLWEQD